MVGYFGRLVIFAVGMWSLSVPLAYGQDTGSFEASVARGGRLYNDWMVEIDDNPPEKRNPNYLGAAQTIEEIAHSWRCVTCHGWDYSGTKTIAGIKGKSGASPKSIIEVLKDKTHSYQDYLDGDDLLDLARFISVGLVDMDKMIERATGKAKAQGLNQRPFFETVCAMCHGAEGQSLPGVSLGRFANQEPYLTLHSIFNGHPGAVMPSLRAFDDNKLVELLAYMQTLPENASLVSIVRGGRLYDNWFLESRHQAPVGIHPAFPRQIKTEVKAKQTWLCRECHGWDYKGKNGQYASGRHFTGIGGIATKKGASVKEIIKILKDDTHEYASLLSMNDLLDLANFVREGQVDMTDFIDGKTQKAKSDFKQHTTFYPTLCGNCHGERGRAIRTMPALGRVANDDPWKALHKILNGHPAEEMPAWRSLDKETILDLLGYIQTLPINKRS